MATADGLHVVEVSGGKLEQLPCCGIMNLANEGHRSKCAWLARQLPAGLRAAILLTGDDHQCGYIEYLPGELAWRAIDASGYMFIHCVWTHLRKFQHQGNGARLVQRCVNDAKKAGMRGVAVLARKKPWLASSDLFLKCGFVVAAPAPPDYELLAKKFRKGVPDPRFLPIPSGRLKEYGPGLTIVRADQCPYTQKFAREIGELAETEFGLTARHVVLQSPEEAQHAPTPYSVFSIVYDGDLLCDHQISKTRFRNIMRKRAD